MQNSFRKVFGKFRSQCPMASAKQPREDAFAHGLRTTRESFFSKLLGLGRHFGLIFFEAFGVFSAGLSPPILVL